ncbi:MAG: lysophospholipase [Actinobacteria bacterium]|nr:lysophospholipase [Actinomycetota bacterium]MCG2818884.1 lysophospholipase [Actinomycetes bacterium]MBU4179179.1 lysophospholipase [Actinomycetota bacterium]MBU4218777.1 lysophospholipase [Actinomycetota bacterium]MBU4357788.1 lysophospholipase [Actinomycetota bacterium]
MKKAVVASSVALACAAVLGRLRKAARNPVVPRYQDFAPDDFPGELFEVTTDDGITLRGKRYRNRGATPLILMHGYIGNCFNYDLAFEEYNFALYLARRGYDVWIANFRGAGREPFKSDGWEFSHSIEDLAIHDLPALLGAVARETGRKPVWIGHSMGAVTAYGYLQGVKHESEDGRVRVLPDTELSRERNGNLAAFVSIAGPTCFRWPNDSVLRWLADTPVSRSVFRLVRMGLKGLARVMARVPAEPVTVSTLNFMPRLGMSITSLVVRLFINVRNMSEETLFETFISGSSDVTMTETVQMLDAMIGRDFTEKAAATGESIEDPHNFTAGMGMITAPVLFVTGDLDPVNHKTVYRTGFEEVASPVKEYRCFPGFSHIDLLVGLEAPNTVFPFVADWLDTVVGTGTDDGDNRRM